MAEIRTIAVIGAGAMGEAMVAGLVDRRLIEASRVTCSHPRAARRDALAAAHGVGAAFDLLADSDSWINTHSLSERLVNSPPCGNDRSPCQKLSNTTQAIELSM